MGPGERAALQRLVRTLDTFEHPGTDRAVGPEIGVERIGIVDANLLTGALGQGRKAVTAHRKIIVDRHAIAFSQIDRLAVQHHRGRYYARAKGLGAVPGVAEPAGDLENPRPLGIEPLLLEHGLDLTA